MTRAKRNPLTGIYTPAFSGGAAAFSPSDISGLVAWYDFSDISTLYQDSTKLTPVASDGDPIGGVDDKSGAGNGVGQTTTAKKPTYKTGIINSRSISRYDGGDALQSAAVDLTGTNGITIFAVFSAASGGDDVIMEMSDDINSYTDSFLFYRTSADKLNAGMLGDVGYSVFTSTASITTTPAYVSAIYDKSLAAAEATNWINGTKAGTQNNDDNNANAFGNRVWNVGARDNAASLQLNGDIGELLVYDTALSGANRQSVESYLASRWAI